MNNDQNRYWRCASVFLLVILSLPAMGCDLCGCFIGVMPYDNQSSFSLQHRYRIFNGISGTPGTVFPSGAYRLPQQHSALHGTGQQMPLQAGDYESFKTFELRGKWFIHPRLELSVIIPFTDNKSCYNGMQDRATGLSDISLLAGWHLIRKLPDEKIRHRLVTGIGIKLPTGNFRHTSDDGDRIPLMMQNGSGSTDAIVWMAYTGGGSNFRWGLSASGKYSGSNSFGEQLSPSESATAFAGYVLSAGDWKFIPQVQCFQEYLHGIYIRNVLEPGSTMNSVMTGPGLTVFRNNISFETGMQIPVYEEKDPSNPLNKARLSFSVNWSFNQSNYLIKSKNQ